MPNDSPSPLALAREAERKAKFAMLDFVKTLGSKPSVPDLLHSAEKESAHAKARRATDEALVEATLRWATTMDAYIEQEGNAVVALGLDCEEFTVAEVLKTIEEANRV